MMRQRLGLCDVGPERLRVALKRPGVAGSLRGVASCLRLRGCVGEAAPMFVFGSAPAAFRPSLARWYAIPRDAGGLFFRGLPGRARGFLADQRWPILALAARRRLTSRPEAASGRRNNCTSPSGGPSPAPFDCVDRSAGLTLDAARRLRWCVFVPGCRSPVADGIVPTKIVTSGAMLRAGRPPEAGKITIKKNRPSRRAQRGRARSAHHPRSFEQFGTLQTPRLVPTTAGSIPGFDDSSVSASTMT